MRLTDSVATAVTDARAPAAALALAYAERIDESSHIGLALAAALAQLRFAAQLADESGTADKIDDTNVRAYRKVAAALSAVTVASDLGPKLLAALDALLLTPKARAAAGQALTTVTPAGSPLGALRAEEDELAGRRARRAG
jgi:hypothetical protein